MCISTRMALARSGACPRFFCRTREYPCHIFSLCSVIERGTPVMCFGSHAKISRFLSKSTHIAALPLSDSDPPIDTSCSGRYDGVVDGDNAAVYREFKHPVSRTARIADIHGLPIMPLYGEGDPTCLRLLIYQLAGAVERTHWWCGPSVHDIRSTRSPRAAFLECALVVVSRSLRLQLQVSPLESLLVGCTCHSPGRPSDCGSYCCDCYSGHWIISWAAPFAMVMQKFGVTHRLATPYHPQTSGHVEVSNGGLKRIIERTVGDNRASWLDKLDDALWAF
nr:reverse transcriptase domain-containing protein [Tanacetum cinerariifolium]